VEKNIKRRERLKLNIQLGHNQLKRVENPLSPRTLVSGEDPICSYYMASHNGDLCPSSSYFLSETSRPLNGYSWIFKCWRSKSSIFLFDSGLTVRLTFHYSVFIHHSFSFIVLKLLCIQPASASATRQHSLAPAVMCHSSA
jgi:hypothetical protein